MLDIILARAKMRGFGLDIEPKTTMPVDAENITYGEAEELVMTVLYVLRKHVEGEPMSAMEAELYGLIGDLKSGFFTEAAKAVEERQRRFGSKEARVEDGNLVDEFGNLLLAKEKIPGRRHRLEG